MNAKNQWTMEMDWWVSLRSFWWIRGFGQGSRWAFRTRRKQAACGLYELVVKFQGKFRYYSTLMWMLQDRWKYKSVHLESFSFTIRIEIGLFIFHYGMICMFCNSAMQFVLGINSDFKGK